PPGAAAPLAATLSPPLAASGFCRVLIPVKPRQAHAQQGATQHLHGAAAVLSVLPEVGPTRDQVTRGHREALLCNVIQCRGRRGLRQVAAGSLAEHTAPATRLHWVNSPLSSRVDGQCRA